MYNDPLQACDSDIFIALCWTLSMSEVYYIYKMFQELDLLLPSGKWMSLY